jgi:phosphoserine aminotransferase
MTRIEAAIRALEPKGRPHNGFADAARKADGGAKKTTGHAMNEFDALLSEHHGLEYLGLAPFLRASIAGKDLRLATHQMMQSLAEDQRNPNLLMNLSIAAQCLNDKELGLAFQTEALTMQQTYILPASKQPTRVRLLMLATQGSIQSNTPLECLLEESDVELLFHYVSVGDNMLVDVPAHDLLFVGIADSDANRDLLQALGTQLQNWPAPVLNSPRHLPATGRDAASQLLQGIPNLLVPPTQRVGRAQLEACASGHASLADMAQGCDFPVILRPITSQAGQDLCKLASAEDLQPYLDDVPDVEFFMAPFVDYSDEQGQYRKIRIALIDGEPFVCHMAVSSNWMVHYVNAGMYEDAWKRREEAAFMNGFQGFVQKHKAALAAISQRMKLEYLVMDCAQTRNGELLLFEIDHGGVVHAMDVESVFPYKNEHINKAQQAFRALLRRLMQPAVAPRPAKPAVQRVMNTPNQLNFSGGPGVLPASVLVDIQQAIMEVPGTRLSLLGISHRSDWFASVVTELEDNVRTLLGLGPNFHVLMLQGGATQQFSMVPMTLLRGKTQPAEYVQTGYWSSKPITEARREGPVQVLWTGSDCGYERLPGDDELVFSQDASYLHYVSNETVEGLQFHRVLGRDDVPRICDMSSDFLSRPCEAERFSIIYAHAQKNIGPAGVTMVLIRDDVLDRANTDLPDILSYRTQINSHSNFNTPPVFSIYVTLLVTRWLLQQVGGLERMAMINQQKAGKMYQFLDSSDGFYQGRAARSDRSLMNAVFALPSPELEAKFRAESSQAGFSGLGGHRAVGGIRASMYNALSIAAVEELLGFMANFQRNNRR